MNPALADTFALSGWRRVVSEDGSVSFEKVGASDHDLAFTPADLDLITQSLSHEGAAREEVASEALRRALEAQIKTLKETEDELGS
jgi:hypothetical protein